MASPLRTIALVAGATLTLAAVGVAVVVARTPPTAAPPKPAAVVDTAEHCALIASRYRAALLPLQKCETDDDCIAEPRPRFHSGLDRCARFRRRDLPPASLADVDALAKAWLDRGCSSLYLTCREERAQCNHATCAELPPDPLPRSYRRVWCRTSFSFFIPPDLLEEKAEGDDSIVGAFKGPKMTLSYDFGRYSNPLDARHHEGEPPLERILSREPVTVSGTPAVLVTMEVPVMDASPHFLVGVHFPHVAVSDPTVGMGGEDVKLTMTATCDALADCKPAEGILRSLEFH